MVLWLTAIVYGLCALLFGQVFGDRFPLADILPTGFLLGMGIMAVPMLTGWLDDTKKPPSFRFAVFGMVVSGFFYGFCLWLLPRVVGLGLIDWPKLSWGVQLQAA